MIYVSTLVEILREVKLGLIGLKTQGLSLRNWKVNFSTQLTIILK
jgi:hypothetical protein